MSKFYYTARDKSGDKISDSVEAPSQDEVITRLLSQGFTILDIRLAAEKTGSRSLRDAKNKALFRQAKHYRVTSEDLVLFCRQLATLLNAGVTILKCLDIISRQVASRKLEDILKDLRKSMEQGLSLHEAMAKHRAVFSELWINLAESGVASGNLAVVLDRLASYLERSAEFKKKIISSLIYPGILMSVGLMALLFLTIKIIPTFAEIFKSFDIKLPFLTRLLILTSDILRKFFLVIIGVVALSVFLFKKYIKTKEGRRRLEDFRLRLPVVGDFFRSLVIERFSSEMHTLIESGVPILYSLDIAERSVDSVIMADIVRKVKEEVRQGKPLSRPLEASGFFEPMVVQMVAIGEEIGEIPQMFKRINIFYQQQVETFLARFVSLFEPLILVFIGVIIGIMVIGMFMPIFQLSQIGSKV